MIYIENNLEKQDVFIPRNDGSTCYVSPYDKGYQDGYQDGIEDCGDCPIQQKEVVLTATTETISPDQGYAGMDSVFVDARQLALEKYNEGYHEGEEDGAEEQKDKLASTAFTQNGIYRREDGWNEVEVAVEQTGTTCNLESKTETVTADTQTILPSSGYDGMSEVVVDATDYGQNKYDEGFTDGQTDILSGMTATAFTQNDTYTNASGWSAVTVNVPQTGSSCNLQQKNITLESGDTSPWAVTPDAGYDGMSGVTITDNGYGQEKYEAGYDDGYEDAAGSACSLQDKTAQMTAATQTFYPDVSGVTVTGIQTDGYSWFDTGVYPNIDTKIEVSFTPFDRSFIPQNYQKSWGGIIGAQNQDDDNATFQIRFSAATSTILGRVGDGGDVGRFNTIYGARYTATLDKNAFILNGSQVPTNATSEDTCDYTIYISAINNGVYHHTWVNHRATPNIFHEVKIWQNNVLIRDYVPVVYNNSPCFYDTVNELYIYNIGSGTCSAVTGSTGLAYDGMASITVDASGLCQDYYDEGYQDGLNDCPACPQQSLEAVSYALPTGFTGTTIVPSSGYDGMSSVAITDGGYGQEKYDEGYQDGLGDCPAPSIEDGVSFGLDSGFTGTTITPSSGYEGIGDITIYDNGYGQKRYNDGYQDGLGDCPSPTLEQKSVTLTATTECFTPSSGYDGFSEVCVDASGIYQDGYNDGYNDAFNKGGDYLTFEFFDSGGIMFYYDVYANPSGITGHTPLTVEYSINGGPWNSMTAVQINNLGWNPQITLSQGDIVKVKGLNDSYKQDYENGSIYNHFWVREAYIYGNTMSLIYGDFFMDKTSFKSGSTDVFNELFNVYFECNGIYSHPTRDLILPATSLVRCCYRKMFAWTSISRAPELPFTGTAWESCEEMFKNCRGITSAPDLLSSGIAYGAYDRMFSGCTNLNYVKCLGTVRSFSSEGTNGWLANVASTGTFVKKANSTIWTSGTSGIPSGWTVQEVQ